MRSHRLVSLTRTNEIVRLGVVAVSVILLAYLLANLDGSSSAQLGLPASQTTCTGTFAGHWSVPNGNNWPTSLNISVKGDTGDGEYLEGNTHRVLKGHIAGNVFSGAWMEQANQRNGNFVFELNGQTIKLSFYEQKKLIESAEWSCQSSQAQASPLPTITPTPTGIPIPWFPRPNSDVYDTDDFKTFDQLPQAEQQKRITKNGPRLPLEYDDSDLSLRVFVRGGWPLVLDYGLDPNCFAQLFIEVEGVKPLFVRISAAKREQLRINIPDHFGPKPLVAKVRITANTSDKEPAGFRLYGIGMGEKAVAVLRRAIEFGGNNQLAMNSSSPNFDGVERFPLFDPAAPQAGSTIQLRVDPPTTIQPRQRPKNVIAFSARSESDFSNGRWEIRLVRGRKWLKVWEEKTGTILPGQTMSNNWDGIITIRKLVSSGNHALKITAWHGRESSRDWIVAQTDPYLIVIE